MVNWVSPLAKKVNIVLFIQITLGFYSIMMPLIVINSGEKLMEMILESEQPMNQSYNFSQTVRHKINSAVFDGLLGT